MSTLRKSIDASSFAALGLEVQRDPFENQLLLALPVEEEDSFEYELAKAMSNRCLRLVEIKDLIILRSYHKLYFAALLNRRNGNYKLIAYFEPFQLFKCNNNVRVIATKHDANTKRPHKKKLFSAFKKGFAIVLDAKAKTYGAKSFSKGKSRRANDLINADKLKDFEESLRPIELSFNDFDLSVKITLENANSTRELRFTSQIDESKALSSQPKSLNRAFDKAIKALSDLLENENDLTNSSGLYSSFADLPSAKFTLINDTINKRKNDTRSLTLKDAAASTKKFLYYEVCAIAAKQLSKRRVMIVTEYATRNTQPADSFIDLSSRFVRSII
ncbi:hypothetical protein MBM_05636 [Drepanopeziza brunnea f. sp. 'multigermtubi' MB_m1]|uniref:Uncharacterized protein n=1 Tax=Marssonina brunnea f. sp. multigermtubi (strain MB_m1) TaxID=1072389 RepID=K1WV58_MARBU|nr:uncharacterized protein MBM_05636 [Drepanopeziza brunnea f. sp. 'multigermtubi' MB_m1]EKD16342.1 hypothetical protein MBM_05636 [Drepanopeziza brunnea f. sp. 'multigermtubi' MB_m1]